MEEVRPSTDRPMELYKRPMDLIGSAVLLVLTFPLTGLIALLIKLDSAGPVIYRQIRVGKDGTLFEILKFRSMVCGADEGIDLHLNNNPDLRLGWERFQKLLHDPRLTRIGRVLRRLSLDELPQLWNVIRGEMSLVGPRPIFPDQRPLYGRAIDEYIQMRPGMTGLWQVSGRNRLSFSERVRCDVDYHRRRSLWLDIRILARTAWVVLSREGAF